VKRAIPWAGVLIAGALLWSVSRSRRADMPLDEVEYRGERFKLSKAYADYDDLKNDPDNLHPSEYARVERAVTGTKVDPTCSSRDRMTRAVFGLRFPGYGMGGFGETPQPDGTTLAAFSVEVPRADKDRVLVFRSRGGAYTLIDDFSTAADQGISQVRQEGRGLVYSSFDGKPILTRPLAGE